MYFIFGERKRICLMLAVDTFIATAVSLGSSCGGGGTDSFLKTFMLPSKPQNRRKYACWQSLVDLCCYRKKWLGWIC